MWTRWKKNISNNTQLQDINLDADIDMVYEINLNRLKDENFMKLKELIRCSPLEKLILRDCFLEAEKLREILEALDDNVAIKNRSLSLELRDNAFDAACVHEIKKLLSKQILLRLVPPEGLDANSVGEILRVILNQNVELTELNIAKSILDPECIELLKQILQNKLIKDKLGMMGCRGVSETCLTTYDKEKLLQAVVNSRRYWSFSGKPNIVWFNYVKHAEASAECNGNYEVCEIEESIRPIFSGKLGKVEKIVRLLVRNKTESEWQLLRSYRKRKRDDLLGSTSSKRIKEEVDINEFAGQMEGNLLKSSDTPTVSSHDVNERVTPPFSSSNGTQWTEVRDRTSFSCMPTENPIVASHYVEESSPRNKAHFFGKPALNLSQHFACNNNHRDQAYENSHTGYRAAPFAYEGHGTSSTLGLQLNPRIEIAGYAIHQKGASIKLSLWILPDGEEIPYLEHLTDNGYTFINASEFNLKYGDRNSTPVTISILTPYCKELTPSKTVILKQKRKKIYKEIDYEIPELFMVADSVHIGYTIAGERGRFQIH